MTATRVTLDDVTANIDREYYFTGADGLRYAYKAESLNSLTFCVIVMKNGTKVVGVNYGAIDPAQHDPALGRTEARKNAIEQIWSLLGYELRTKLAGQQACSA